MSQRMTFKEAEAVVKNSLDIVDVVGRYVALRRAGRNMTGLCPFHQEKTPSFSVSPDKQLFKCFGCGEGGDALSFLMRHENKTYGEVITDLAADRGIEILKEGRHRQAEYDEQEVLIRLNTLARDFFVEKLQNAEPVKTYLAERRIPPEWQAHFGLGYAPPGWENLLKYLRANVAEVQKNPHLLERAGLVNTKGEGSGYYDRFRNRLMIPVQDDRGRVVAFGARTLDPQDEPKYLNSPETSIYVKNKLLYGFSLARDAIRAARHVILMEGYFDVISAHMAGLTEAVGVCGTSLTENHLKLLQRVGAETLYLCFDADKAGQTAALRAIELVENHLLEQGISLRVVALPGEKDPDDFLKTHGREGFMACLAKAQDFLSFKFDKALERIPNLNSPEGRIQAVQQVMPMLLRVAQPVIRMEHLRRLSERLGIDEETLVLEMKRQEQRNPTYGNKKSHEFGAIFLPPERYISKKHRDKLQTRQRPEDINRFRRNLSEKIPVEEKEHHLMSYLFIHEESYRLVMNTLQQMELQSSKAGALLQAVQGLEGQWQTVRELVQQLSDHFRSTENTEQLQFLAHCVMVADELQERCKDSAKGLKSDTNREKLDRDIQDIVGKIRFLRKRALLTTLAKDGRQHEQQEDDATALQIQLKLREQLKAQRVAGRPEEVGMNLEEEQGV